LEALTVLGKHDMNESSAVPEEHHMHRRIAEARLRILEFAPAHTLDELLEKTLDEAELLSGSRIGFYHFVDSDQVNLTLQNWSTRTKAEYCEASGKGEHYPISTAGVWTECVGVRAPVIQNDYATLEGRKGMPDGHAELVRELVVPVMRNGLVRAILGVGNKQSDYDQEDLQAVSMLADLAWDFAESKLAQQALEQSESRYRMLYEHMNEGVIFQRADGHILSANRAAQRILGLTVDEFTSRTSLDPRWKSVHEDGSPFPGSEHPTMVALRTGLPVNDVTIGLYNPVQNRHRWMIVSAVPLFRAGDPTPYEAFVTLTDITELKQSRKDVDRSNELLVGLRDATSHLLAHYELSDEDIDAALRAIAVSSDADCAYIFENREAADEDFNDREGWFSWCREGGGVDGPPSETERVRAFRRRYDRFSAGDVVSLRSDATGAEATADCAARGVSSVLAVPVFSDGRLWGSLTLEASGEPRRWDPIEVETVRKAASTLGATVELSNRALRDPLTGLYNRRYLGEVLVQTLARAARESSPLSVVSFDIDDFKSINDSHGHAAGDHALREIARHLAKHSRAEDTIARLGGDEFAVVMPNAAQEDAVQSIERWRRRVEIESPSWGIGGGMRLTISAGVSSIDSARTVEELLEQADRAMLSAKQMGRNRSMGFKAQGADSTAPKAPVS
jgi:diguanylate cyclase (GGDEF)-like protein